jgi:hypothetical protein
VLHGKPNRKENTMRYRVYIGPRGTEAISPLEKDHYLFKEFSSLDDAFAWARHVNESGRVTLAIDGDDGTSFRKQEIAAALNHPEAIHAA